MGVVSAGQGTSSCAPVEASPADPNTRIYGLKNGVPANGADFKAWKCSGGYCSTNAQTATWNTGAKKLFSGNYDMTVVIKTNKIGGTGLIYKLNRAHTIFLDVPWNSGGKQGVMGRYGPKNNEWGMHPLKRASQIPSKFHCSEGVERASSSTGWNQYCG